DPWAVRDRGPEKPCVTGVPDRHFLVSVFLMEAWDTLSEIEEHGAAPVAEGHVEPLLVLTHRLKGAAALNGFPGVAALASAMEAIVEKAAPASAEERHRATATFDELIADLKAALDTIAAGGDEDTAALIAAATSLAPPPQVPAKAPRPGELAPFFPRYPPGPAYLRPHAA